jgi:hypothetical protein
MDFIEQIFGVSPDGGSGLLETLLFLVPLTILIVLRARHLRTARLKDRQ